MNKERSVEQDLDALWRTIYGEAEPHDELDALAIGWTVINRVKWPNWPNRVRGVCYQPWQYSCWNRDNPRLEHLNEVEPDASPWASRCHRLARDLLAGTAEPDPTRGATHYYASYIEPPAWARGKRPTLKTDGLEVTHLFFNDIDTPAPKSAGEALEQQRPLEKTRSVRGGRVAAGAGGVALVSGAIAEAAPALPALGQAAALIREHGGLMLAVLGALVVAGAAWALYARWDDRARGLR